MFAQHRYRPHHLALAIALAVGCTDFSYAQQTVVDAGTPSSETPEQLTAQLEAFINHPDTTKTSITRAVDGFNRAFSEGNDLVTVSGRGSLTGVVDGRGGTNFLQLDTASGGTLGESRNFEGLELKRSTWTVNSPNDFKTGVWVRSRATLINDGGIEGGALIQGSLVNTGKIWGNVTVQSGGTLTNSGTVVGEVLVDEKGVFAGNGRVGALQVNGRFSVDKIHGAPTVSGDLRLSKTAELTYEVDADRKSATVVVDGTASLGDATLNIVASSGDYPTVSANTILLANRVEGEFGKVLSNLAFLTPKVEYEEQKVDLILTRNDVPIESFAITENGEEFAQSVEEPIDITQAQTAPENAPLVVEALTPPTGADTPVTAPALATAANPAPSPAQPATPTNAAVVALLGADIQTASHAIEQLAGSNNANLAKATLNSDSPISTTLLSAMRQLDSAAGFGNQKNSPRIAAGSEQNSRIWLQALGHGGTLDRDYDPLKHSTQGLVMGADWRIDEQWRIGVMAGKSDTRLDSRDLDGDLDSWHLGAYAQRQNGPVALRLGATYSNHDGSTQRRVAFNGFSDRPLGHYDASTQQAFAEVGYNLGRANVSIEPFASLGYQRYQRDGYTEKGGAAALKVQGQTQNNLNSTFGLRLAKINTLDNGMQLTPRFSAGWKHTYADVYSDTRQRLVTGGKNYSVYGAPLDRDSLLVDAGLDLGLSANHTLGVGLNGEFGTDSRNHGVTGQWRMNF
ncbi:autotransporter domain-containing protein [Pseudomonas sp. IT-P294]|uniref:autotransporter outer membrane beta-barrel domain-containing protein n=1 Tax=Pseudomonas sp. IT-P294 TaxID=3026454 RepID=UPI0039DFD34E